MDASFFCRTFRTRQGADAYIDGIKRAFIFMDKEPPELFITHYIETQFGSNNYWEVSPEKDERGSVVEIRSRGYMLEERYLRETSRL